MKHTNEHVCKSFQIDLFLICSALFRIISGGGYGDYPRLEEKPIEQRDNYYPYDFPEMRRNFQEPVGYLFDFYLVYSFVPP